MHDGVYRVERQISRTITSMLRGVFSERYTTQNNFFIFN